MGHSTGEAGERPWREGPWVFSPWEGTRCETTRVSNHNGHATDQDSLAVREGPAEDIAQFISICRWLQLFCKEWLCAALKRAVSHAMGSKTMPRSPAFPPVLTSYKLLEIERT